MSNTLIIPTTFVDGNDILASETNGNNAAIATFLNTTKLNDDNLQTGGVGTTSIADAAITLPKISPTAISAKTTNYTITTADDVITFDCTSGNLTATLPTAVGNNGRRFTIKKIDSSSNYLALATTSSQTVDGLASAATGLRMYSLYDYMVVVSNGANWLIINEQVVVAGRYNRSGSDQTISSGAATTVVCNDSYGGSTFDMLNTGSGLVTVPRRGVYSVTAHVYAADITADSLLNLHLYIDGSAALTVFKFTKYGDLSLTISTNVVMTAGQTIDMRVSSSDTAYTIKQGISTGFSIVRVGRY